MSASSSLTLPASRSTIFSRTADLLLLFEQPVAQVLDGPVLQGDQAFQPFHSLFHGVPP